MRFSALSFSIFFYTITAVTSLVQRDPVQACNNSPSLCSKSYADIVQLGAHDSPFLHGARSPGNKITNVEFGNQDVNSTSQLDAGVRFLTAQVHESGNALHLCHTDCSILDAGLLSVWLGGIQTWLDSHPNDVVSILLVNSDNTSTAALDSVFHAAEVAKYGFTPSNSASPIKKWPTLSQMILAGTRLVTFIAPLVPPPTSASGTTGSYLLDEFTFLFENAYQITSPTNFTCTVDRPPSFQGQTAQALSSGRLPLLNHMLYKDVGLGIFTSDLANVNQTNAMAGTGSLGDAIKTCTTVYGRLPAVVLVDYFDQGQAMDVVDKLNGIVPVGRISAGTMLSSENTSTASVDSNALATLLATSTTSSAASTNTAMTSSGAASSITVSSDSLRVIPFGATVLISCIMLILYITI